MHHTVDGAAVQGRNIPLTSLLTMGESWHNNHHAFPGSARLGLYAGELGPGWWALLVLRRLGLVWGLRLPQDLAPRAELRSLDAIATQQRPAPTAPRLAELWCLAASMRRAGATQLYGEGPAALLSAGLMRRLLGPKVEFHQAPAVRRLSVTAAGVCVTGCPPCAWMGLSYG